MKLHVVDGTYELYRAHFSKRPDHFTPDGMDMKATVGITSSILGLLQEAQEGVTHVAVAFDNPIVSFRNDLFDGYKTDEGVPPELRRQFDTAEEAIAAIGVTVWSMKEFEADDALATAAARWRDEVDQVRIMTPDKDLGQCIVGKRVVQFDRRQVKETDETAFIANRGFVPKSMPDFLGLVGDTADGIPGLPGFGEKSASQLLGHYERIENIPDQVSSWKVKPRGADKLAATLQQMREEAMLYRKLATLREDVPLKETLEDLRWTGIPRREFEKWTKKIGLNEMKPAPHKWRAEDKQHA